MGSGLFAKSLTLLAAIQCATSATYSQSSSLTGQKFLDAFTWHTAADPNFGRVNYIDYPTAQSKGLVSVSRNQVTLRADSTTKLNPTGPGRDSFSLASNDQYTTHVAMHVPFYVCCLVNLTACHSFDIAHMPEGCGTWPAVCTLPGEIDIVEGINNQSPDSITLHTRPGQSSHLTVHSCRCPDLPSTVGCTMPSQRQMSGTSRGNNCNVYETDNTSCGVKVNSANSFGPSFNAAGGGWYVIERTPSFIKVFFWSRHDPTTPKDVSSPGPKINTGNWGTPAAYFPSSSSCDFNTHLTAFNIVIDLDFCGAWAGNAQLYSMAGCPSTCADYVNSNPSAFQNAYFTFNALTIYE
ncbi:glycoside hydrolase family 16 protein [Boletus reticuloceps]|uniref:Glycoside hydrolase family 16 protein n=1 Tax=Boletus reticuloceps TaxID=495285 RepID=A0A8I2Z1R8_9AGAM|nr:glycoside hydrolase family 16 protein [Boletus reticuloceps]